MKKLFINGRVLGAKVSGVPRYARQLIRSLDALLADEHPEVQAELLLPTGIEEDFSFRHVKVRKVGLLRGHAWEQFELPFYTWGGVLFTPTGSAPFLHPVAIPTIHDATVFAAPEGFNRRYRTWYRIMTKVLGRTATHIITVSQFSRSELVRWCGIRAERISVIYPGCDQMQTVAADTEVIEKFALQRYKYVLAVGSTSPNKNFGRIVDAVPFLPQGVKAVFVGQTMGTQVGHHGARQEQFDFSQVVNVGYVSDAQLRALYENAGCFLFPSLYEGFGSPPVEALSLGCPTVISNAASLPEVSGEVSLICDPYNPQDIAAKATDAMKLRENPENAEKLIAFASRYRYDRTARELWEILAQYLA